MDEYPGRIYIKWRGETYLIAETETPGVMTLKVDHIEVDADWFTARYESVQDADDICHFVSRR